jgi:hypothetical protein
MAHRQFTDSAGTEWLVFDVMPRLDERRVHDRRGSVEIAADADRREDDRRVTVGAHPPRLTKGWLCFERPGERRRLQPIPRNWDALNDAGLQKLLASARVAPTRGTGDSASVRR